LKIKIAILNVRGTKFLVLPQTLHKNADLNLESQIAKRNRKTQSQKAITKCKRNKNLAQ
jgi:hypothetical protein